MVFMCCLYNYKRIFNEVTMLAAIGQRTLHVAGLLITFANKVVTTHTIVSMSQSGSVINVLSLSSIQTVKPEACSHNICHSNKQLKVALICKVVDIFILLI